MRKLYLFLMLLPIFCVAQTQNQNYVLSTVFNSPVKGQFSNYTVNFGSNIFKCSDGGSNGGASGTLSINNNILNVVLSGSWSSNCRLNLGNIIQLNTSPKLPDMELGPILKNGLQTGYHVKIKEGNLFFYSPYYPIGSDTYLKVPYNTSISYSSNLPSVYECISGGGGSVGNLSIMDNFIILSFGGGWDEFCNIKLGIIKDLILPGGVNISYLELGTITNKYETTVFKAKIENNKLIFYNSVPLLAPITAINSNLQYNFQVPEESKLQTVTYTDGLGRPIQRVEKMLSASRKNIVVPISYDIHGRQSKEYLPYRSNGVSLEFEANAVSKTLAFYQNPTVESTGSSNFEATNYPYAEKVFEDSPLNKLLISGQPGANWRIGSSHELKFKYGSNAENEVRKYKVTYSLIDPVKHSIVADGFYFAQELYKFTKKNENWKETDGFNNTIQEYQDKEGNVILKRHFEQNIAHDTYYVYNNVGLLCYVISPEGSSAIDDYYNNTTIISNKYMWPTLLAIDEKTAYEYEKRLNEYEDKSIAENELFDEYGGQGGITISHNNEGYTIDLNFISKEFVELRTGTILSLKGYDKIEDGEIGSINGIDYSYTLSAKDGNLVIEGKGRIKSLNTRFSFGRDISLNRNYSWAEIVEIDESERTNIVNQLNKLDNSEILETDIKNQYGAKGGINLTIDSQENISVNLNITSEKQINFVKDLKIPLKLESEISDRDLGYFRGKGYNYHLKIQDNVLTFEGEGSFEVISGGGIFTPVRNGLPSSVQNEWCYIYNYDSNKRIVEKYIPSKGWSYIIYDKFDRPVLNQDDNLKGTKWLFSKYDAMNRIVYTGEYTSSLTRSALQNLLNSSNLPLNENFKSTPLNNSGISFYYSNNSFPINNISLLTVNYYDNYNFLPSNSTLIPKLVYGEKVNRNVNGLLTGSYIRVLGTTFWTTSLLAYDIRDNKTFSYIKDNYLEFDNTNTYKYDFSEKIVETETVHNKKRVYSSGGNSTISWAVTRFNDYYTFDHANRPLIHTRKMAYEDEELLSYNKYDELGQIVQLKIGGKYSPNLNFENTIALQTVDYSYNIRGWLKQINNPDNLGSDLFAIKINYDGNANGTIPMYDGNISQIQWKTSNDLISNTKRSYNYNYDSLSRLKAGRYSKDQNGVQTSGQYDENITYDRNGNILTLQRFGGSENQVNKIDDLSYNYQGNQLMSIRDYSSLIAGFKDYNTTGSDYHYDKNGNLDTDLNKSIGTSTSPGITYNHLNLPETIIFNSGNKIKYDYDATGTKLKKTITQGTNITITEYNSGFVYQKLGSSENTLQYFPHNEGYIKKGADGNHEYVYQYKDHLGNIRLSFCDTNRNGQIQDTEVIEENNYYPYGLEHVGYNSVEFQSSGNSIAQKIKYNGKELQDELGLGVYDYGARNYDPAIGRWFNIDPKAENSRRWTPYNYAYNNPMYFVDPDGMQGEDWFKNILTGKAKYIEGATQNTKVEGYSYMCAECEKYAMSSLNAPTSSISEGNVLYEANGNKLPLMQGVTIGDPIESNENGNGGISFGLSIGGSVGGGIGAEVGLVKDFATNNWGAYFSFKGHAGLGGAMGVNATSITPTTKDDFLISDFGGTSMEFSAGVNTPFGGGGVSYGGTSPNAANGILDRVSKVGEGPRGYTTGSLSPELGGPSAKVSAGALVTKSKTWVWDF